MKLHMHEHNPDQPDELLVYKDVARRQRETAVFLWSRREFAKTVVCVVSGLRGRFASAVPITSTPKLSSMLSRLRSPVLLHGDATTAFRDPAVIFHAGWFYLYFTLVRKENDGVSYSYVAWSKSLNLRHWDGPNIITTRGKDVDFGSPGDIVRVGNEWVLCLQTYPRPHGEKYGNGDCRIWTMRSEDLEHWGEPELLMVKGPSVPREAMGRMIDPYILRDKDAPEKWWCFYKQNGISISWSNDLRLWTPYGRVEAGENPCVLIDQNEYVLFHSPSNGIGIKRSPNLEHWRDEGVFYLGQSEWPWAQGRLTAAFVVDLRNDPSVGRAVMFFHGSQYPESDARGGFDNFASIGVAWSSDLREWSWPKPKAASP